MKTFREALRNSEFAVTVGMLATASTPLRDIRERLDSLRPWVDAVQFGHDESTDAQIAPIAAAGIALQAGVDPIVHMSCRDRNRIALQSDILGALSAGVTTLVLRRGEKLPSTLRGRVKGVFDIKSTQLLTLARRVSDGSGLPADGLLSIGSLVEAIRPGPRWAAKMVTGKLDNGANFLQTRPCLDIDLVRAYVARLVTLRITHRASLIVSVPMLTSTASALSIAERHPGTIVPENLIERLATADDARSEAIAWLAETIAAVAAIPGVSGIAIVNADDTAAAIAGIRASGILP